MVLEDALWKHEDQTNQIFKRLRELPGHRLAELAMDLGLYDRLRERGQAG